MNERMNESINQSNQIKSNQIKTKSINGSINLSNQIKSMNRLIKSNQIKSNQITQPIKQSINT